MKRTTIVLTFLLTLAPALASAQQGPPAPVPPAPPAQGWRGVAPRAGMMRRGQMARRMARLQGRMGRMQGPGFALRGQAWAPGAPGMRLPGFRGQLQGLTRVPGMRQQGPGPFGPLANPQIRQQLNLTDAQVKQLDELRASLQKERQQEAEQMRAERQKLMEQVRAQRQKEQESVRAERQKLMQELQASNQKLLEQRLAQQKQMQEKLQQLLTPEQRSKLEQLQSQRPLGRGMGPGMPRGTVRPDSIR